MKMRMRIETLDGWLEKTLGPKPDVPARRNTKRIRPSRAPGPDLANKPVITSVKRIAIPPQNLAYRWLYNT